MQQRRYKVNVTTARSSPKRSSTAGGPSPTAAFITGNHGLDKALHHSPAACRTHRTTRSGAAACLAVYRPLMNIFFVVVRVLLGILFIFVGLNGFLLFVPPPPTGIPPHAVQFNTLMYQTHYVYFTTATQLVAGVLLVINRYVTLALVVLAAVLANIVTFHITMWPQALVPMPIIALLLWFATCWPLRRRFATLFASRTSVQG